MPPPTPSAVYEKSIYPKVYLQRNDQLTKHPGTVLSQYNVESVNGKKLTKKLYFTAATRLPIRALQYLGTFLSYVVLSMFVVSKIGQQIWF